MIAIIKIKYLAKLKYAQKKESRKNEDIDFHANVFNTMQS